MTQKLEKGHLLYDESHQLVMKKRKKWKKIQWGFEGISGIFTGIFILIILFLGYFNSDEMILVIIGGPVCIFFGTKWLIEAIGLDAVRVYENGITHFLRHYKEVINKEERFISFDNIDAIYLNRQGNYNYVLITGELDGYVALTMHKKTIYDMEKFKKALEGRVNVIDDRVLTKDDYIKQLRGK